jgi:pyrroline-5-carboxylate reductase
MDVTVLAASGTAFALRYIRFYAGGIEIGFDWKTALAISAQTVKEQPRWSWKNKYIQNN